MFGFAKRGFFSFTPGFSPVNSCAAFRLGNRFNGFRAWRKNLALAQTPSRSSEESKPLKRFRRFFDGP